MPLELLGRVHLVAIGGAAFATNELLDERDNAVLAAALLAPTSGTVSVVTPQWLADGPGKAVFEGR